MKYTYRYSREPTATISWTCPICLLRTCIDIEDISRIGRDKYRHNRTTDELCCSLKCTKEYEKRIRRAIAWCRGDKVYTGQVTESHYNNVSTFHRNKYPGVATTLANLGEYFPFNPLNTHPLNRKK